jgi:competence protein ComEA
MRKPLWKGLAACVAVVALVASPVALGAKKKTDTTAADASDKTDKVNLNTADEKDIAAAKGVGEKLAKELVKSRPYKTWDDVSKVKGVGSGKKLDSLKKVLKLSEGVGAAAAKEQPAEKKDTKSKTSSKVEEKAAPAPAAAAAPTAAAAPAAAAGAAAKAKAATSEKAEAPKLAPGTKININTASAEELDKLPEIGPVKAQAIVEYRKANGPFKSAEDIEKVKGIKEGTFAKIKDFIVVK